MKLDVLKTDGTKTGEQIDLSPDIFEIEPNEHVVWQVVTAERANARQGTAKAKTRAEISGGGKKPWPQKGRGTARAGSTRSPVWRHGGRVFGPKPHTYKTRIPLKVRQLARKSALSALAKENKIRLVEDFAFEKAKTRQLAGILNALQTGGAKTLLLTPQTSRTVWLSGRNIPSLQVREAAGFSTYDVVNADMLLIQKSALGKINEVLGS
ncbi:50S ribosomal protein L4 [bacterium]|nr:50S ribosomal protein L4 [bacterium]